jgi:hypothetical protein
MKLIDSNKKTKAMKKEELKNRLIKEIELDGFNVIDAGTREGSNPNEIGYEETNDYYVYFQNNWYFCYFISEIIDKIEDNDNGCYEYEYEYSEDFKFEECEYYDVGEYAGVYEECEDYRMSDEICNFVKSTFPIED